MQTASEMDLVYKFANAPIREFPYPHFFIENVFPKDFYDSLQANIPDPSAMIPLEQARNVKGYDERFVLEIGKPEHHNVLPAKQRDFWRDFAGWLCSGRFGG